MADKITKLLAKMPASDRRRVLVIIALIAEDKTTGLNIKKISGSTDRYRAHNGRYRVIYSLQKGQPTIIKIAKRNEKTYK